MLISKSVRSPKPVCPLPKSSKKINIPFLVYGSKNNENSLARCVFSALREVDEFHAAKVYIHAPSKNGVGLAVYNRLLRAAAFRVIEL